MGGANSARQARQAGVIPGSSRVRPSRIPIGIEHDTQRARFMVDNVASQGGSWHDAYRLDAMTLGLPDDARKQSIASIKRYFLEELDQDVGELKAGLVLDFFLREIAPTIYNGAIADAQTYVRDRLVDLEGACSAPEFAYWPTASVRRASR